MVSKEQSAEILLLLQEGLSREEIASRVGVSPRTVSAIKAHTTMGTLHGASEAEADELIEASEATFGLERDLQDALRSNVQQLEPGLSIVDDNKERTTGAGRGDIIASDQSGTTVVIELKAGTAEPQALTQLLTHMGVVVKREVKPVRGILVARDFHPRLVFTVEALPNVQLCRYRFKFTFERVE